MQRRFVSAILLLFVPGCGGDQVVSVEDGTPADRSPFPFSFSDEPRSKDEDRSPLPLRGSRFVDASSDLGIQHVYRNGESGQLLMVEPVGGGCGWLDYDRDGLWDLFLNQGGDPTAEADKNQPSDALYRCLGRGKFQEVTDRVGIREFGYGQGVAIGDFDDDGFDDIYVTNVGQNSLWQNRGDGTFQEVTDGAGVVDAGWNSSAAWADLDLDGDLDLYVCGYLAYDPKNPIDWRAIRGKPEQCDPKDVDPWPDECFINDGNGTFTPQARQRGLFGEGNKALGVTVADFNNDGLPDVYVANDTTANHLFVNRGRGHFVDKAFLMGCAADRNGLFQASMGLGIGDYDNNGYLDIYCAHFYGESNTLYENHGPAGFQDVTGLAGLHGPSMPRLGFGVVMADFNQDGLQEIFVANGHINNSSDNPRHKMRPQLFAYDGARWMDRSAETGVYFHGKYVGRGVAACDYDNDGDWDLAVVHQNAPTAILRNDSQRGHWLKILFRGRASNRRGIGCRATVATGKSTLMQELCGGTSYASTQQPALIFGLGDSDRPCKITVRWPSGCLQVIEEVSPDQVLIVEELDDE